ncbi:MAG: Do family serine endopeptidase, partial [bacterium]
MSKYVSKPRNSRFPFFVWIVLLGTLIAVGIGLTSWVYPLPVVGLKGLQGPLYRESVESHLIDPNSLQGKIIKAVETVSPAVVSISTEKTIGFSGFGERDRFFGYPFEDFEEFFRRWFKEQFPEREFKQKGLGSGMIINKDGFILTNEHVIHEVDKDKIRVTLPDGRNLKAEIVETDEESDLAVLKIKENNLPVVTLGDSERIKVGQWAIALGNPYGFALSQLNKKYEPTVTVGVISATGRAIQAGGKEVRTYSGLIQTDASINPGNSGGPLVNVWGEVIGINAAILTPSGGSIGIGFAIPINKAKRILESIVKYGKVAWPWIGIYMQELTPELSKKFGVKKGVLVSDVMKDSPAETSGIQAGDVVEKVNGKEVSSPLELKDEVLQAEIGKPITLTIIRAGKKMDIIITPTEKPEKITPAKEKAVEEKLLGIEVRDLTPDLRREYDLEEDEEGVAITKVKENSPAARVGLSPGDVIKEVNRDPIKDLDDFKAAMQKIEPGDVVLLRVRHGLWTMFVTL